MAAISEQGQESREGNRVAQALFAPNNDFAGGFRSVPDGAWESKIRDALRLGKASFKEMKTFFEVSVSQSLMGKEVKGLQEVWRLPNAMFAEPGCLIKLTMN